MRREKISPFRVKEIPLSVHVRVNITLMSFVPKIESV